MSLPGFSEAIFTLHKQIEDINKHSIHSIYYKDKEEIFNLFTILKEKNDKIINNLKEDEII